MNTIAPLASAPCTTPAAQESTVVESQPERVFDYQGSLTRLGGDPALFANLVTFFLEDVDGLVLRLRSAVADQGIRDMELAAHSIKGLCANFGADRATAAALAIERSAQMQALDGIAEALEALVHALVELKAALAAHPGATTP